MFFLPKQMSALEGMFSVVLLALGGATLLLYRFPRSDVQSGCSQDGGISETEPSSCRRALCSYILQATLSLWFLFLIFNSQGDWL